MSYYQSSPPMATAVPIVPMKAPTATPTNNYYSTTTASSTSYVQQTKEDSKCDDSASVDSILNRVPTPMDEEKIQTLMQQGFTRGLALSLNEMMDVFALRIWIVDNSGSMQKPDGHRIIPTRKEQNVRMVPCSRWEEIVECVQYHIQLAGLIGAPTRFRLLNNPGRNVGPQQFSVAERVGHERQDVHDATQLLRRARPGGCTPLVSHILDIHTQISQMAPALNMLGKKVVIVIATDGLPTDERGHSGPQYNNEFVDALRLLEGLPVWVVVRLCTDEDDVVDFYNDLDTQLELSLEVLDDFHGEAVEVIGENPWLNYALPLHRLREMGYHDRVFDMLDERPLTKSEIREFCALLFGEANFDGVPDPSLDWSGFVMDVKLLLHKENKQYDPVQKRVRKWISTNRLNRIHGHSGCSIM